VLLCFCHYFTNYYSLDREYLCFVLSSENMYLVTQKTKLAILFSQEISKMCDRYFVSFRQVPISFAFVDLLTNYN